MKRILVSDIHGNAPALEKVVGREGLDKEYLVLGDIHGLLGYPFEVVETLQFLRRATVLAGNHDRAIFEYGEGHVVSDELSSFEVNHTLSELSDQQREYMESLPYFDIIKRDGSRICLCHAMPWPEKASGYETGNGGITKGEVPHFASIVPDDYDYVFHGHSHEQYDLDASRWGHPVTFVNPGSLGYDHTYTVVDTETGEVEHKSVEVDEDSLKKHINSVLPEGAPPTYRWL